MSSQMRLPTCTLSTRGPLNRLTTWTTGSARLRREWSMVSEHPVPAIRADHIARLKAPVEKTGAVVYCRVSTEDQLKNFSIETQETDCRAYCRRRGYQVIRVFIEAESAKTVARPVFQEMLKYCAKHHATIGSVVVWAVSRFARSMMDHLNVREELRTRRIRLLSCTQE